MTFASNGRRSRAERRAAISRPSKVVPKNTASGRSSATISASAAATLGAGSPGARSPSSTMDLAPFSPSSFAAAVAPCPKVIARTLSVRSRAAPSSSNAIGSAVIDDDLTSGALLRGNDRPHLLACPVRLEFRSIESEIGEPKGLDGLPPRLHDPPKGRVAGLDGSRRYGGDRGKWTREFEHSVVGLSARSQLARDEIEGARERK